MLQLDQGGIPDSDTGEGFDSQFDRDGALDAVDAAVQYGRARFAGNMPTVPGTQSESGIPAPKPEPGRLGPIPSGIMIKNERRRLSMNDGGEQSFAEGGEVEPEDQVDTADNGEPAADSGAGAASDGAIPAEPPATQAAAPQGNSFDQPGRSGLRPPHVAVREGAKKLMALLMGAGAAPAQEVQAVEQQVDPEGTLTPSDRKLQAIKYVSQGQQETPTDQSQGNEPGADQQNGAARGFAFVQHYRQKYDFAKAHAAAASMRGDLQNAANSANIAFSNVPDGYNVNFQPTQSGIRADMMEGDKLIKSIEMNPRQFQKFLRSPQAQFDTLLSKGSINLLAAAGGQQTAQADNAGQNGDEAELDARSRKMFPYISQEPQRQKWIADQLETRRSEQATNEAKVATAGETAKGRVEAAKVYAGGRQNVASIQARARLAEAARKAAATATTARERNQANMVRQALQSAPLGLDLNQFAQQMKQQGIDISKMMGGTGGGSAPAAAPQAPAANGQQGTQQGDRFWRDAQGNIIGRKW